MNTKKWWNVFFMVGNMILFFAVFALILSWEKALIISGSLFFHEYGHIFAMQRYGMKVKGMYFIPFLGGAAVPASRMPSKQSDVVISLAGPVFGLVLAFATAIVYALTGWTILGVAVVFMAALNLFNLLPVFPLDGGRVLSCIAQSVDSRIGTVLMGGSVLLAVAMFFLTRNILVLLVGIFAVSAFMDFIQGRSARAHSLLILERMRRALAEEGEMDRVSRAYYAALLKMPEWEDGPLSANLASSPSVDALQNRLEEVCESLREHPWLPLHWIAMAVGGWMIVVGSFCILMVAMIMDTAVAEGAMEFFQL